MIGINDSAHAKARMMKWLVLAGIVTSLGLNAAWHHDRDSEASEAARVAAFIARHIERCVMRNILDRDGCTVQALSLARELHGPRFRDRVAAQLRNRRA